MCFSNVVATEYDQVMHDFTDGSETTCQTLFDYHYVSMEEGNFVFDNHCMTMCDGNESMVVFDIWQNEDASRDGLYLDFAYPNSVGTFSCLNSLRQWEETERLAFDDWWHAVAYVETVTPEHHYELKWSPAVQKPLLRMHRWKGTLGAEAIWGSRLCWHLPTPGDCLFESIGYAILGEHVKGAIMRQIGVIALSSPTMRTTLLQASRQLRMSASSYLQAIDSDMWGGRPDLCVSHLIGVKVVVWDHLGNEIYNIGDRGRVYHLGYRKRHYVVVKPPSWWTWSRRQLLAATGQMLDSRGGSPTRRTARAHTGHDDRLKLRSRSPPTARDWHLSKAAEVKAIEELDFAVEKTWLVMRKWGVGTLHAGWDVYYTACSRWADGIVEQGSTVTASTMQAQEMTIIRMILQMSHCAKQCLPPLEFLMPPPEEQLLQRSPWSHVRSESHSSLPLVGRTAAKVHLWVGCQQEEIQICIQWMP